MSRAGATLLNQPSFGGIFTNTLLTLLVLPALNTLFKRKKAAEVEV